MRRENKRVEFRKSKNLKFWTFRILKIINDRSLSTALKPMIQIHSEKSLILIFFEQLNRAGNSSRKIIIILMSNNIFRQIIESIFHGPRINELLDSIKRPHHGPRITKIPSKKAFRGLNEIMKVYTLDDQK